MKKMIDMDIIWDEWNKHYKSIGINTDRICKDGIINPEKFCKTKPKILFVMKDVNDIDNGPKGDLPGWLKEGPKYQLWFTIARWSAGIFNKFPPYKQIDLKMMKDSLEQVAAINLKKTCGGARVDSEIISAYTHQDRDLLLKQINSINPNLIIACGVMEPLIWLLNLKVNPEKPAADPIKDLSRKTWIIPFRHPARATGGKIYNNLKKVLAKIDYNL
ncbi:MAG: hypothetical protein M0R20_03625 [Candidatus Omnitrophica bacterium]|jgi:hypothetical protein|nr:hypothetical protein [Candidatus Omnitrophota bacterium]